MGARTGVGALGLVLLAILVFLAVSSWSRQPAVAKPSIQPITFPHSLHVQTYKMDCQYCHSDARRSEYAGLPSVARCMGCHKIAGAALPEVKKLAEYYARGEPIPWVRVNKLPEFTYFPHKAHLRANVKCQTCHGPVETMTTFCAVTGPRRRRSRWAGASTATGGRTRRRTRTRRSTASPATIERTEPDVPVTRHPRPDASWSSDK